MKKIFLITGLFFLMLFSKAEAQEEIFRLFDFPKIKLTEIPSDLAAKWTPPEKYEKVSYDEKTAPEEIINRYRRFLGLSDFIVNETLQTVAKAHAKYLSLHPQKGLDVHTQNQAYKDFFGKIATDRCKAYGFEGICGDIIAWDDPTFAKSIELTIDSHFHRPPLLTQQVQSLGCGSEKKWYVCVLSMELASIMLREIHYPAEAQIVSGKFLMHEYPPAYPELFEKTIGPTISYFLLENATSLEYGLFNLSTGSPYDLLEIDPATEVYTLGFFTFNPREIIPDGTEVLAVIRGTYESGKTFEKYWSFSIGREPDKKFVLPKEKKVKKKIKKKVKKGKKKKASFYGHGLSST